MNPNLYFRVPAIVLLIAIASSSALLAIALTPDRTGKDTMASAAATERAAQSAGAVVMPTKNYE
jgi:hypothetical protein